MNALELLHVYPFSAVCCWTMCFVYVENLNEQHAALDLSCCSHFNKIIHPHLVFYEFFNIAFQHNRDG